MAGLKAWFRGLIGRENKADRDFSSLHSHPEPPGPEEFGVDNNHLALALYDLLREQAGNLFFSPFSIRAVLAMAYAGARGETAAQISEALHFSYRDEMFRLDFSEIIQRLNAAGGGKYEMAVANSL